MDAQNTDIPQEAGKNKSVSNQTSLRRDINQAVLWALAAPVTFAFCIASFLPVSSLLSEGASALSRIIDGLFLVSGFGGITGAILFLRFLARNAQGRAEIMKFVHGNGGYFCLYATVWLSCYIAYRWVFA
ncbi:MAG: hypothetical protein AAGD92_02550 [Pseudomonadota bacterium]